MKSKGKNHKAVIGLVAVVVVLAAGGGFYMLKRDTPRGQTRTAVTIPSSHPSVSFAQLDGLLAAVRQSPNDASIALEAGAAAGELGDYDQALALFKKAESLDSKLLPAITGQGQMWSALQRPGRAAQCYERALRLAPEEPALLLALSREYLSLRDFPEALRIAKNAEKLAPSDPDVYRTLSLVYGELVLTEESLKAARKACELMPKEADNWVLLGSQLIRGQKFAEAESALKTALALAPASVSANLYYARALVEGKRTAAADKEAFAALSRVRITDPGHAETLLIMGGILTRAGNLPLAISTLRQARESSPGDSRILIALGQALIKSRKGEEGVRLVNQGQKAGPLGISYLDLEEQVRKSPDPALVLRLADLYMRQNLRDQAIHVVEKALKRSPGNTQLAQRLRSLEH